MLIKKTTPGEINRYAAACLLVLAAFFPASGTAMAAETQAGVKAISQIVAPVQTAPFLPDMGISPAAETDQASAADSTQAAGPQTAPAPVWVLSLEEAVQLTLANNVDLQLLEKQVDARQLDLDRADYFSNKIIKADQAIHEGWQEFRASQGQLATIKAGIAAGAIVPGSPYYLSPEQVAAAEDRLQAAAEELRGNAIYEIDNLANAQVAELYQIKAGLGLSVTQLGCRIARQKYALLTEDRYFQVLKEQRLVAVKKAAAARAAAQARLAADTYQAGFRAKDDMLLAQAQASLMQADLILAENQLGQTLLDLKKVMYLPLDREIKLQDDFPHDQLQPDLDRDLSQARQERLEIKKAEMELTVAQVNMELAKRYLTPNVFDYRQIALDLANAQLGLAQQHQLVEGDVRASYNNVMATAAMLKQVTASVAEARQAVEIAAYRYQEGYGIPTAVLKSMSMEDAAGTIFEVLAAEEKLSEVEEKVVEITAAYHLARGKYAVDICQGIGDEGQ